MVTKSNRLPARSTAILLAAAAITVALATTATPADRATRKKVLVELYTSQG